MRIRSTKPEFWTSKTIAALPWDIHYDGPLPARGRGTLAPTGTTWEYVYLLFTERDELLYVGRSWRPVDRFTKHGRKSWWPEVSSLVLVRIHESPRWKWADRESSGPNTRAFERAAIAELRPAHNVVGVAA